MSDTPRTDAMELIAYGVTEDEVIDYHALLRKMTAHARQLERDLATERETMTHWQKHAEWLERQARELLEHGPSTGESPTASRQRGEGSPSWRQCTTCSTSWDAPVNNCPSCGGPAFVASQSRRNEEQRISEERIAEDAIDLYLENINKHGMESMMAKSEAIRDFREAEQFARSSTREHWVYAAAEEHRELVSACQDATSTTPEKAGHLWWMLDQIRDGGFSPTKACRWLGWVQACLYWYSVADLEGLKAINKRASDAFGTRSARV